MDTPDTTCPAAGAAEALPNDGFVWMTHPSRFNGRAIPVWTYVEDGVRYYVPFEEGTGEYEWDERSEEWELSPSAGAAPVVPADERTSAAPDETESWPIAKLTVRDGEVSASLYAPGLPDGEFDLWLPETRFTAARDGCSRHEGCVYPHCACDPDSWDAPACAALPSIEKVSAAIDSQRAEKESPR